jgi:UrcA family protein
LEIDMNTKAPALNAKPFICIAAAAACAVLSGPIQATDHEVTVKISVSTAGLDLSQPAVARELYARLREAARIVCTHGMRINLIPPTSFVGCYEKALGDAVRTAHQPQLSTVYLATHTRRDADIYGIEVPVRIAAE